MGKYISNKNRCKNCFHYEKQNFNSGICKKHSSSYGCTIFVRPNQQFNVCFQERELLHIADYHIANVGKMDLPWFSADNKQFLEKVLFFHKMDYPSEMDMELIVIIEGSRQPTVLFYDGINFYSEEANGDICFHKVTHWMPLPEAPKELNDKVKAKRRRKRKNLLADESEIIIQNDGMSKASQLMRSFYSDELIDLICKSNKRYLHM